MGVYLVFGVGWVLLSDRVLELFVADAARRDALQTWKGALFVLATAGLFFALSRRQLAERRVLDEEVRAVLDGMTDAVLVIDRTGAVADVNRAAVALLGAGSASDLRQPYADLLARLRMRHPDGRTVSWDGSAVRRALGGETVTGYEAELRSLEGRELFISVSAAPLRGREDEPPRYAVAVMRDMSEVKAFEDEREEFLATAAHEFKTPLAVVKAYAQLMRKRGQGDPAALDVIDRQTERLTRMVQQLLEVSRFRAGGTELRRERFDLAALVRETAREMASHSDGRRIFVEPSEVAAVLADRARIGHVVASLFANAVRFSPEGGDVEAAVARQGAEAVVWVRDHGLGIPADRRARIFERYYRAHAGTPLDYGGLGVGLDLSREIVARHGGRIWFESEEGRGSTFSFSLPLAPEERA
ncbi:MAG TPA: ATP-binding protein [Anaeromyxobacteraceae bacterium]|nr:ATP-binding protein [Anaeromyxobacteraceae bacterium]